MGLGNVGFWKYFAFNKSSAETLEKALLFAKLS